MEDIVFLSLAEVIEVHKDQVEHYGGHPGLRDYDLLCSAVAVPEATYGGVYLHSDIFEMAAAYLYHIGKNHPFVDGNKRTGLACSLVFLEMNGITLLDETGILYETVMSIISESLKSLVWQIFSGNYTRDLCRTQNKLRKFRVWHNLT